MSESRVLFSPPLPPQIMGATWQAMEPLVELTSEAAKRYDRWLFIASLLRPGCFAVATMRCFVRQHGRLMETRTRADQEISVPRTL